MRTETKILLTAIRNACKHDQRIDDFLKGFTMQIPLPIMKAKLDENADILGVVLTELYNEMTKELSKQQEQTPVSTEIEEQLEQPTESEVPAITATSTTANAFIEPSSMTVNPMQILMESMEEKSKNKTKKKKSKTKSNKSEE